MSVLAENELASAYRCCRSVSMAEEPEPAKQSCVEACATDEETDIRQGGDAGAAGSAATDTEAMVRDLRTLHNPFEAKGGAKKFKQTHSLKYAVFEVLKDTPDGLGLSDIVRLIDERKLRSFAGKASSSGQACHKPYSKHLRFYTCMTISL